MNKKLACTVISASLLTGCESTLTEIHATPRAAVLAATSVTPIDISNGIDGGPGGRTISHDGVILGEVSRLRSWWQSSASPPNILDSGFVNGGNRNADAAGGQAEVILSSNGGPPWTSVTLQSPPGTAAGNVLPSDINDSRVVVGRTVGTFNIPLRWPSPTSAPEQLSLAGIQYPVYNIPSTSRAHAQSTTPAILSDTFSKICRRTNSAMKPSSGKAEACLFFRDRPALRHSSLQTSMMEA
jgi:hypothetical protein